MNEEALIEAVKEYPCIREVSHISYRDSSARENAWKEVTSQAMNVCHVYPAV